MLGPSGCGKTTMLRMIAGFEEVTSGSIRLDGVDVSHVPPYRRNVNTVFQHYALFPHMTVFDNVAFGPRTKGVDERRGRASASQKMLDVVRLGDFAERRPDQLSGGQRQRVALARALVNFPERPAARRAAQRARSQAAPGDADRAQAHPARGRHHLHLRHPRSGRSADHVRPHRGDERRPRRAGRHAGGDLPLAGDACSSPASSARPTCCRRRWRACAATAPWCGSPATAAPRCRPARHTSRPARGAMVMVRPERMPSGAGAARRAASNAIPVTLAEMIFQGPVVRFVLRDARGRRDRRPRRRRRAARRPRSAAPRSGRRWDPAASRLLPPRPPARAEADRGRGAQ